MPGLNLASINAEFETAASGKGIDYGATVPSDGAKGYIPGALFFHVDGSGAATLYRNAGTLASADFNQVVDADVAQTLTNKTLTSPAVTGPTGSFTETDLINTEFDPALRTFARTDFCGQRVGLIARLSDYSLEQSAASYNKDWVMSGSATAFGGAGDSDGGAIISASNSSSFAFIKPKPAGVFGKLKLSTSKSPRFRAIIKTGTITNARMIVGLYSSAVPKFLQNATNYAHRAELKLDQNADSRFHAVVANGTASSSGTVTGVIASDTVYDIEIRINPSRIVSFYVNNTLAYTATTAIAASKNLVPLIGLQSEGAKRSMKVYHVMASRNI